MTGFFIAEVPEQSLQMETGRITEVTAMERPKHLCNQLPVLDQL
jgi:hypothetical protein